MGFSPFKLYWMDGLTHRVNIYIEDKATQIVLQLENFMSFDRNSYAFMYTHCTVYSVPYGTQILPPPSLEEDRVHILSKKKWMFETNKKLLISFGFC